MNDRESGAFSHETYTTNISGTAVAAPGTDFGGKIGFNASNCNSIYGNSDIVQPPSLTMIFIIKY